MIRIYDAVGSTVRYEARAFCRKAAYAAVYASVRLHLMIWGVYVGFFLLVDIWHVTSKRQKSTLGHMRCWIDRQTLSSYLINSILDKYPDMIHTDGAVCRMIPRIIPGTHVHTTLSCPEFLKIAWVVKQIKTLLTFLVTRTYTA